MGRVFQQISTGKHIQRQNSCLENAVTVSANNVEYVVSGNISIQYKSYIHTYIHHRVSIRYR